ncbi:MAG: lipopolysaccharide biosynthesis protein [Pseudonocardia sp.]
MTARTVSRATPHRMTTAAHLAVGLAVLGVAGYAFVAVAGHVFDGAAQAGALNALISLYLLVNIIGPGIFAGLEQATSRAVSAATARGDAVRPILRRAAVLGCWTVLALAVLVLAAWPVALGRVLDGQVSLLVALIVAVAGSAAVYWTRGVLGGRQRFPAYARTLYVEGAARLAPCLVLLALAVTAPGAYGLAFALGSFVAALSVLPALRAAGDGGTPGPVEHLGRSFGYLVVAIALSQLIANLAPVVVSYRMPDDAVAAGVFGATFVLARIPLFLFAPVQAVLLPKLTRAATLGRRAELVRRQGQAVAVALGVGGLGALGCLVLGPWAAQLLFDTATRPAAGTVGLLGLATLLMMVALVLQPTLVALGRQRVVTTGWVAGTLVFLAVLAVPAEPIAAALAAQLAGPVTVLVVLGAGVVRALSHVTESHPTEVQEGAP